VAANTTQLFREEALDHHRGYKAEGRVMRIDPTWTEWSYWLVVGVVISGLLFSIFGTIHEYATGAAVVRVDGREVLTAPSQCTVADVAVRPGQRVSAGEVLVKFYLAQEESELARVEREYDGMLLRLLRDPSDQAARTGLTSLHAEREHARARVAERSVVAAHDGTVTDVRVRAGQALNPGDAVVAMATDVASARVVAMVPANYRPMIRPGMPMRIELSGFRFAYQELYVDVVGDEAVGPAEVRRFLGPDNADTVSVEGPVVLVQARLPATTFQASGQTFQFYDGMVGSADVRVRTESILVDLVPGLKDLFRRHGG
jgi:multidrug resistance efflux pump